MEEKFRDLSDDMLKRKGFRKVYFVMPYPSVINKMK